MGGEGREGVRDATHKSKVAFSHPRAVCCVPRASRTLGIDRLDIWGKGGARLDSLASFWPPLTSNICGCYACFAFYIYKY